MKQIPHKCPVCCGSGKIPEWQAIGSSSASEEPVDCQACNGKGIVWGWESAEPQYPPVPYYGPWWGIYPPVSIPSVWTGDDLSQPDVTVTISSSGLDYEPSCYTTLESLDNIQCTPTT